MALSSGILILLSGLFVFTWTLPQLSTKHEVIDMIPTTGISLQLFQLNKAIYAIMTDKQMQERKRGSERHSIYINTCTQKILYSSDTRDTFLQIDWNKQPVTNTIFGVIEDAKHAPLCHHTSPVPLDKQSTELAVRKTLFIHGSEAHSAFTSMTLQKMNVFSDRPIQVERAYTSFIILFEYLQSQTKPHVSTSQCNLLQRHKTTH